MPLTDLAARRRYNAAYHHDWNQANRDKVAAQAKRDTARLWSAVVAGYGGACACCGEAEPRFLTLDHVHGGGTAERRVLGENKLMLLRRLVRQRFPSDLQLLCANCHLAKDLRDGCPHAVDRAERIAS